MTKRNITKLTLNDNGYLSVQWVMILAVIIILCTVLITVGGSLIESGQRSGSTIIDGSLEF